MLRLLASSWVCRWSSKVVVALALVVGTLWAVGDNGIMQHLLNGVEERAIAHRTSVADRYSLRMLYSLLLVGGRVSYPQAAELLAYYRDGRGDTLRFDSRPLLQHSEVQQALQQHRPGITFRHQTRSGPFYVVQRTDWPLYYAFDLLYIKRSQNKIVFYDNYFFQPLARRSYTPFRFGRLHVKLNDGLIRVAYPASKPFIAYSEVERRRLDVHEVN